MVIAVFRARVKPDCLEDYERQADVMAQKATVMPGFVSYKIYTSPDGERLSLHEWESAEQLRAWREDPEHVQMQEYGRQNFYEEYTLYVSESLRESRFPRSEPSDEDTA